MASGRLGDTRNFTLSTRGFDVNNTTRFDLGNSHHALNYGADSFRDEVDTTGFGTVFTPSGERTVSGAFVQLKSDIAGIVETITAARYDTYALQGGGNYNDGNHLSPKSTVAFTAVDGFTPYVTYAEGYRAPALTETLVSGIHPSTPQFTLLPNPGLQPEIGKNKEFGVNLRYNDVLRAGDQFRAKFNMYRNDVTNYIDLKFLGPFQRGQGGQVCLNLVAFFCEQYQNIPSARLEGIEFETSYDTGLWFAGLSGTHHVRGRDLTNDLPLATVPPDQVTTTLGTRLLDKRLTLAVRWQAVMAQESGRHSARGRSRERRHLRTAVRLLPDLGVQPDQRLRGLSDRPGPAGVTVGREPAQRAVFPLPRRDGQSLARSRIDAAAVLQSGPDGQRVVLGAVQRSELSRRGKAQMPRLLACVQGSRQVRREPPRRPPTNRANSLSR